MPSGAKHRGLGQCTSGSSMGEEAGLVRGKGVAEGPGEVGSGPDSAAVTVTLCIKCLLPHLSYRLRLLCTSPRVGV